MAQEKEATAPVPAEATAGGDVESQTNGTASEVTTIVSRWRSEDLMKKGWVATRVLGLIFSIISFLVMVCNNYGDFGSFQQYNEYRYFVAISILSMLYTAAQSYRQIRKLSTGKQLVDPKSMAVIDFIGDQVLAYFLISSFSAALPLTNNLREVGDSLFTDSSMGAIAVQFLAFTVTAISAGISGSIFFNRF